VKKSDKGLLRKFQVIKMTQVVLKLEEIFNRIAQTRMIDLPILNSAMRVEAVGFRLWEGHWVGVLVTPWMINLVLLKGEGTPLLSLALGEKKTWRFPSGNYEFMGLNEPMLGACHICSLISPVVNFTTHKEAVTIAQEIISALFVEIEDKRSGGIEEARLTGKSTGQKEMSRRDFLRIPLMGSQ
jgi:[NiFe] hydrogenase assembly HybE family chaperone